MTDKLFRVHSWELPQEIQDAVAELRAAVKYSNGLQQAAGGLITGFQISFDALEEPLAPDKILCDFRVELP